MERKIINPWKWQDDLGFVQASEIRGADGFLLVAGQASVDSEGRTVHSGDMRAQMHQAFDNLETVLSKASLTLQSVVRITYYVTNMDEIDLASPDLLIEIEATAVF